MSHTACVVIGRNEAPRLRSCLVSALAQAEVVVFVDSASTDHSVEIARTLGVEVVALSDDVPLSAARARNAGVAHVARRHPAVRYVQLLDGDSVLAPGWLPRALEVLEAAPDVAVVAGRLRERDRDASVYNRLCDLEWMTPVGDVDWVGGIAMVRVDALRRAGGFDETLIAGEEPDLCKRLRGAGWRILAVADPMARHDASMMRFGQWWQRNLRAGYAYAEAVRRDPDAPAMDARRQLRSIAAWGLALPATALALSGLSLGLSLAGAGLAYAGLVRRIERSRRAFGLSAEDARLYALYCTLGKLPQAQGVLRYRVLAALGRAGRIIEHRTVA